MSIRLSRAVMITTVALVPALAACGSSAKSSGKSSATTTSLASSTTSTTLSAAQAFASVRPPASHYDTTISFARLSDNGGLILVGPNGHSLYLFDRDTASMGTCTGQCASTWPPLTAADTPTVAAGLVPSKAARTSTGQVTYNEHPLYSFSGDRAPGDTNGLAISGWHVVSPIGTGMMGR